MKKKLFIVVNVDWFFLSHRLPIALEAKRRGYSVTIIAKNTGRENNIIQCGLSFIPAPFLRSGKNILMELYTLFSLWKIYKKERPDIVHHVTLKPCIYGSFAARLTGIKQIVNAVSGLGYNFTRKRKSITSRIIILLLKLCHRRKGTQFIFQNVDDKAFFSSLGILHSDNTNLIKGSGVDLSTFSYAYPIKKDKIKILFLARMLYNKGVIEFVSAAALLKDNFYNKVEFILCGGEDKDNPSFIPAIKLMQMEIKGYITWVGHQQNVVSLLTESDIIVLPSYREGLPKSLIEACAIGRPIVTTDVPGCRECVIEGYNGFKVPMKDSGILAEKIKLLIENEKIRIEMGRNSRVLAEKEFSLSKVINQTMDMYLKKD